MTSTNISSHVDQFKNAVCTHLKNAWKPMARSSDSLLKDVFSKSENIEKLGLRITHICAAILLGVAAVATASFVIAKVPVSLVILGTAAAFTVGLGCALSPEKVKGLIDGITNQITRLRARSA